MKNGWSDLIDSKIIIRAEIHSTGRPTHQSVRGLVLPLKVMGNASRACLISFTWKASPLFHC